MRPILVRLHVITPVIDLRVWCRRTLTDVRADKPSAVPSEDAEKIFALVSGRRRPADIRKVYRVLRAIFDRAS